MESKWTLETLKEYVDSKFEKIKETSDLKVQHFRERRQLELDSHSLFFKNLTDRQNSFDKRIELIEKFINHIQGKGAGLSQGWGFLIGGVSLLGSIIAIYYAISKN